MPNEQTHEYLSFGDSLFLYLERKQAPLNIASLGIFKGEIPTSDFRNYVASKLSKIPRYMQKVVMPPMSVGTPHWEFAHDFRLARHIHEVKLKHGTIAELKAVTARILSQAMDRNHPLWDLTLIHGLKDGRTGLIARVHHCLADGISGMGLINVLMDYSREKPVIRNCRVRVPHPKTPAAEDDVIGATVQSWFSTVERMLKIGSDVLTLVQRATGLPTNGTTESAEHPAEPLNGFSPTATQLAAELTELPERLPFNVLCQGPQRFEWTEIPLDDFKAVREKCDAMINDIVLAVMTAAFRRYSELHGVNVRGRTLRIVVPVSTRRHHNGSDELGNHITFAPLSTPLGVRNPKKLLGAVHEKMQFVKTARVPEFVAFAGTLLGTIPTPLQAVLAPLISALPISLCNTICTNVPGPKKPLYLLGHEMLSAYPYVPIGGEMGINCAVLSYNGTMCFGFTGDVNAAPDLEKLPKFVQESVAELKLAFGVRRRRAKIQPDSAPEPVKVTIPPEAQSVSESLGKQPVAAQPTETAVAAGISSAA